MNLPRIYHSTRDDLCTKYQLEEGNKIYSCRWGQVDIDGANRNNARQHETYTQESPIPSLGAERLDVRTCSNALWQQNKPFQNGLNDDQKVPLSTSSPEC